MTLTTVMRLLILCVIIATITAYHESSGQSAERVFRNENVNIIMNLDAKLMAEELWKLIEIHLNKTNNHANEQNIIKELEMAVIPLVAPTRKGMSPSVHAYQVADELDQITRNALIKNIPNINKLDEEIMTRDIVADMMATLKGHFVKKPNLRNLRKINFENEFEKEIDDSSMNDDEEDYVNVRVKISKNDIIHVFH